jgi:hypothetical protein
MFLRFTPVMARILLLITLAMLCLPTAWADENQLEQLDYELSIRDKYVNRIYSKIDSLRHLLAGELSLQRQYELNDEMLNLYTVFRSDSAMRCIDRCETLAKKLNYPRGVLLTQIGRAYLLATSGIFSEAERAIQSVSYDQLSREDRFIYYRTKAWINYTQERYVTGSEFSEGYHKETLAYMDSMVMLVDKTSGDGLYWLAMRSNYRGNLAEAEQYFCKSLERLQPDTRLYASAACGLALLYQTQKQFDKYEYWIIKSAITDQHCALKENFALQSLSEYLANEKNDKERANRYMSIALEDAIFYNNRLRLTQIARNFPDVVYSYQHMEDTRSRQQLFIISIISILSIGLIVALYYLRKEIVDLRSEKRKVDDLSREAQQASEASVKELSLINNRLRTTNRMRERYASLFVEMYAAYVEKFNSFQKSVDRKVKAKQFDSIMPLLHTTRMKDDEARAFFHSFDTAFLALYPTFIEEFNALLLPDKQVVLKKGEVLNTELRIMGLIRIGVNDTHTIATLLFYSPQTVYNYRSQIKARAISPETFDADLMAISVLS